MICALYLAQIGLVIFQNGPKFHLPNGLGNYVLQLFWMVFMPIINTNHAGTYTNGRPIHDAMLFGPIVWIIRFANAFWGKFGRLSRIWPWYCTELVWGFRSKDRFVQLSIYWSLPTKTQVEH